MTDYYPYISLDEKAMEGIIPIGDVLSLAGRIMSDREKSKRAHVVFSGKEYARYERLVAKRLADPVSQGKVYGFFCDLIYHCLVTPTNTNGKKGLSLETSATVTPI